MRKFSKGNNTRLSKRIELMIKIINRTDSYLNSANTKSTILLSLASGLIVALSVNFDKIIALVVLSTDKAFLSILVSTIMFLLIASVLFSLKGLTPFVKASASGNVFSFVDIALSHPKLADYEKKFSAVSDLDFLNQLVALHHTLSKALVDKYKRQVTAIKFLEAAAYVLGFSIYIIILSNF